MKISKRLLLALPTLLVTLSAQAHDPQEHMKGAERPDCSAMENMDHSKMDSQDPVTQAMMQKCMPKDLADEASHGADEDGHRHDGRGKATDAGDHDHQTGEGDGEE